MINGSDSVSITSIARFGVINQQAVTNDLCGRCNTEQRLINITWMGQKHKGISYKKKHKVLFQEENMVGI